MDNKIKCLCLIGIIFAIIGWELPIIPEGEVTYINATSINSTGFAVTSADNVSLISEINNGFWFGNETTNSWIVEVTFTNVSTFSYVESKSRYFSLIGASTHVNDIEIWCNTEQSYVDLEEFTNENEWWYYSRNIADTMHFIMPNGTVKVRYNHTQPGNANHRLWIDTTRLILKPQFERINVTNNTYINTTTVTNITNITNVTSNVNYTVIFGAFYGNGTKRIGNGFTVTRHAQGLYNITFNTSFLQAPVVLLTTHSSVVLGVNGVAVNDNTCGISTQKTCVETADLNSLSNVDLPVEFEIMGYT